MSSRHLVPPQDEKKDAATDTRLPVDHTSYLDEPEEKSDVIYESPIPETFKFLVPPQEKKSTQTEGKSRLDYGNNHLEDRINARTLHVQEVQSRDDAGRYKQISDAARSGAAGVTGEDVGVADHQRLF